MSNYLSIGDVSEQLGISSQTLRNWEKDGFFQPHHKTPSGTRYYTQEQVNAFLGLRLGTPKIGDNKVVIGYCRVSSAKQKDDLERQVENVKTYLLAKGYQFEIITDIGSGINYNKKGLNTLIDRVMSGCVEKVVVLYKDRLLRFGYELVENMFSKFNTTIEVIDNTEKTEQQELVEDLVQIITVFSCKLQGKRSHHTKQLINELIKKEE